MRSGCVLLWALVGLCGVASAADLDVDEGECVVFRFGESDRILVDLSPAACDTPFEEDGQSNIFWIFGDGHAAYGDRVAHQFADEGDFVTRVNIDDQEQEQVSVSVANAAPEFRGQPPLEALIAAPYRFEFLVKDTGYTDQIRVELAEGPPEMRLTKGDKDCAWVLRWDAPPNGDGGPVSVVLRAWDGAIDESGDWIDDGGEQLMAFEIELVAELSEVDGGGMGTGSGDGGVDTGPASGAFTGSSASCDCDLSGSSGSGFPFLLGLLALVGLGRRRR